MSWYLNRVSFAFTLLILYAKTVEHMSYIGNDLQAGEEAYQAELNVSGLQPSKVCKYISHETGQPGLLASN
jgi:hypothetical protein